MTDNAELKRLAEAATPGRNFDRLPEAGGGLKYECTGDDGSLVLKVDHKNDEWGFVGDNGQADEKFFLACTPSAVLALIAENERIVDLNHKQFGVALQKNREIDELRAEIAGLKTGYQAYERVNAELKAEVEGLRKDAERWRFFSVLANDLQAFPHAWGKMTPEKMDAMCDQAMADAALGQGEQS